MDRVTTRIPHPGSWAELRRLFSSPKRLAVLLFVAGFLGHLPFVSEYLVNWDAVNFALGVEEFDIRRHQPHPPGYLGYVLLGRLTGVVVGDGARALVMVSLTASAVAPALTFLYGRRLVGHRGALVAAVLLCSSPLVLYYGGVALTYVLELAMAVPIALLAHRGRITGSTRDLVVAGLLLAALGAVRQTSVVLLAPLVLAGVWSLPWRGRFVVAGVSALGVAAWLVPLLMAVGGPRVYFELSSQLAELTGGRTWVLSGNLLGMVQNLGFVLVGLLVGLGATVLWLPGAIRRWKELDKPSRTTLLLWALPALVVYTLIHTGQLGYVLVILPIGFLLVGADIARRSGPRRQAWTTAGLAIGGVILFLALPSVAYRVMAAAEPSRGTPLASVTDGLVEQDNDLANPQEVDIATTLEAGVRQFDLRRNDTHWHQIIAYVEDFDPETTAVLANPTNWGSFRHLAYYAPDYRVYGLGLDLEGSFGYLHSARGLRTNYEVQRLESAADELRLPSAVTQVVIPDLTVAARFEGQLDLEIEELDDGLTVAYAEVPPGMVIHFLGDDGVVVVGSEGLDVEPD